MARGQCNDVVGHGEHLRQCSRKTWKDGYCKQHHPDTVAARYEKSVEAYRQKIKNSPTAILRRELEEKTKQCEALTRANLALMTFGNVQQAVSLLHALVDLQNVPPLERYKGKWVAVMGQAVTFLEDMEDAGVSATEIKPIGEVENGQ